jgi:hypothetical protein
MTARSARSTTNAFSPARTARISAAHRINAELVLLYWDIGRGIVEKQKALGSGESVFEEVSADLRREFPGMTGFSARNIWDMKRIYPAYSEPVFLAQAVREMAASIRWGHHVEMLNKLSTAPACSAPPCIGGMVILVRRNPSRRAAGVAYFASSVLRYVLSCTAIPAPSNARHPLTVKDYFRGEIPGEIVSGAAW